jgi:uncharacterized protein YgiM (DUF1202 family)
MARFKQVSTGLTLVCERKDVIEQYENGWAKVEYNKKTGYIKSQYLRQ